MVTASGISAADFVKNIVFTAGKGMVLWGSFRWGVSFVESFHRGEREPGVLRRAFVEGLVKGGQMGVFVAGSKTLQLLFEKSFGSSSWVDFVSGFISGSVFIFRGESNWAYLSPYIIDAWNWSLLFRGWRWPPFLYRLVIFLLFGYLMYLYETRPSAMRPYVVRCMDFVWKDRFEAAWEQREKTDLLIGPAEFIDDDAGSRMGVRPVMMPGSSSY